MTHRFGRTAKETLLKATRLFIARKTLLRTFRKAVRCLSVPVPYKKRTYLPSLQDNIIKVSIKNKPLCNAVCSAVWYIINFFLSACLNNNNNYYIN